MLTRENYQKGFLIDEDVMAGVSESEETPGAYSAFILSHRTGEVLEFQQFEALESALNRLNGLPRSWKFEASAGCGGGDCKTGGCGKGPCKQSCQVTGACELSENSGVLH